MFSSDNGNVHLRRHLYELAVSDLDDKRYLITYYASLTCLPTVHCSKAYRIFQKQHMYIKSVRNEAIMFFF